MFHGYDFDNTMLRIGSMNMQLHGLQNPNIAYRDSLAEDYAVDYEAYSLIVSNPPFAGSLDYEGTAKDLLKVVKTKKTELLFLALFLRQLKPGGRAAVIVPHGVLFGSTKAHKELRRILVEDQKLDGIAQRSESDALNLFAIGHPHLQQTYRDGIVTVHVDNTGPLPLLQTIERGHQLPISTRTAAAFSPRKLIRWLFRAMMQGVPERTIRIVTPLRNPISASRTTKS